MREAADPRGKDFAGDDERGRVGAEIEEELLRWRVSGMGKVAFWGLNVPVRL